MEISRIYETAAIPELWPLLLDEVTKRTGAYGASLITVDNDIPIWVASPEIANTCSRYHTEGWAERNPRVDYSLKHKPPGFVRDIDIFSREEIEMMPLIRDFFIAAGGGWGAGLMIPMPTKEILVFSVDKAWKDGPLSDDAMAFLEELRPHLSRAALLTAKLRFERARAAVASFEIAGVPAALIHGNSTIVAANDRFVSLDPRLKIGAWDKLQIQDENTRKLAHQALDCLAKGSFEAPLSLAVPGDPPAVMHFIPSVGEARDLFGQSVALLLVSVVKARTGPDKTLLAALFDLTPAEARVTAGIVDGHSIARIAAQYKVSRETVRTQMRSIFQKTGTSTQAGLVRAVRIDLGNPAEPKS